MFVEIKGGKECGLCSQRAHRLQKLGFASTNQEIWVNDLSRPSLEALIYKGRKPMLEGFGKKSRP